MEESIKRKIWMPVTKTSDGVFHAILSDTSIDRDEEFMADKLIENWAKNKALPALADHNNSMVAWVGGWKNLRKIMKKRRAALTAEPFFFSKEANPLAAQIEKQIAEASDQGLEAGISISAIVHKTSEVKIKGEEYIRWDEAELLEATWVPIQSNRNASFQHIAKSFDFNPDEDIKNNKQEELDKMEDKKEVPEDDAQPNDVDKSEDDKVDESEDKSEEESSDDADDESSDDDEESSDDDEEKSLKKELAEKNVKIAELEKEIKEKKRKAKLPVHDTGKSSGAEKEVKDAKGKEPLLNRMINKSFGIKEER